jgi:signal peptidase I
MDDASPVATVPAPSPAPAAAASPPRQTDGGAGNVKETLEQILVAFILAFIFRAFIVEAFVIPTGSMAPTLLGAHTRYRCPDCGYRFDVNYSTPGGSDDTDIPSAAGPVEVADSYQTVNGVRMVRTAHAEDVNYTVYCPNCGYKIDAVNPSDPEDNSRNPQVFYGDRILVLKYLYLFRDPKRWDVVVFKNPDDPTREYQTNYIKRLVGKPGETVMVLDGDVYLASKPSPQLSDFVVQTKPRYAQEALWRISYDNDYHPQGRQREDGTTWVQPWHPEPGDAGGWDLGDKSVHRNFTFNNLTGTGALRFDDSDSPDKASITNWLGYDSDWWAHSHPTPRDISDLKLSLFYQRTAGDGPLRLAMTKRDTTFTAVLTADSAELLMTRASGPDVSVGRCALSPSSHARHVELTNVDYHVTLRIDDTDVLSTTPQQYHPDVAALLSEFESSISPPPAVVRIIGDRQQATLSHIALWHDVYYTNDEGYWASPRDYPHQLARLGKDEYFVLGDNSLISGDARYWTHNPVNLPAENLTADTGRVPGRFLLGKAFFVYWPAGFRPVNGAPALVPDFGDMRFIH